MSDPKEQHDQFGHEVAMAYLNWRDMLHNPECSHDEVQTAKDELDAAASRYQLMRLYVPDVK